MRLLLCFLCLLLIPVVLVAQPKVLENGFLQSIDSGILQEQRSLLIHLPDSYSETNGEYPVLVILDGEWSFRNAVAITEHLSASGRIPSVIVVGIANTLRAGRPSRLADLTPAGPGDVSGGTYGGADLFMRFIIEEVLPFIEDSYRCADHRILSGHSLGGLFTIHTMLNEPEAFEAFIAISPSLGRNNQQQVKRALEHFSGGASYPKAFHLSRGDEGGNTFLGAEAFATVLESYTTKDFRWRYRPYDQEDHVSVVYRSLYDALEWIYEGWKVPENLLSDNDISIVQRHYKKLSERLGFKIKEPEEYYRQLGYQILAEQDFDYAKWTFDQYHSVYPSSAVALVGLADVALMRGEISEAIQYYTRALELNPQNSRANHMKSVLE